MKNKIEIKLPVLVKLKYLKPNPWNPNKVFKPEMDLLELSVKKSGFCFPIVVIKEAEDSYMIVDGFHRHLIAKKLKMEEIPVVILDDPIAELRNATVRFNRARGTQFYYLKKQYTSKTQIDKKRRRKWIFFIFFLY